ncbi:MAG: 2-amino-4-hydroxy-6-hydroxymethyldihydropteridine diphosphokinase [Saprospiraceae bacterium]|jgi:2-amino-4-hydroxy-6-hydroxymethyldihydropteridine diphosphokinase
MAKLHHIYLGIGTNLGDRRKNLVDVEGLINLKVGPVVNSSKTYETAAWGLTEQPDFFNQVLSVKTTLDAEEVLREILEIETHMGRIREEKWGARIIDIDILYYNDSVINLPHLKIPHPFIQERNFVLIPLLEIAPDHEHPILKLPNEELFWKSKDESEVIQLD